ncbi:MAG: ribonuclease P protein component [Gammaproteobacteria bacterium]|nr:ribonuclease P protein component [Gammaproteobacteria bacterium]
MSAPAAGAQTQRRPHSFPVCLRLTRAADFEAVFKEGRRSADQLFTVLYRPSGLDHARLGMAASAKRIRTAVGRNRIRRLIRESFRQGAIRQQGLDIVVLVKEPAVAADNAALTASLAAHWSRLQRATAARA